MSLLYPKFKRVSVQIRYERLVAALAEKPRGADELCAPLFSAKTTVISLIARLRTDERREVRITKWKRARTGLHPIYALGSAPDAKKPKKRTASQQYRHIMSDPAKVERRRRQLVEKQRKIRAKKFPTLLADVLQHVQRMGSVHTPDITKHIGMSCRTVLGALLELEDAKRVMRIHDTKPIVWSPFVDFAAGEKVDIVQVTRTRWAPPSIPKQSIFAALGL